MIDIDSSDSGSMIYKCCD